MRIELRLRKDVAIRPWPTDPRYWVTSNGHVFENHSFGRVRGSKNADGYWVVNITPEGKAPKAIHQMVLEAFIGPRPNGCETRHLNGLRYDNRLLNLRWGTSKENSADAMRHQRDFPHRYKKARKKGR